jgi:hypothetical protein
MGCGWFERNRLKLLCQTPFGFELQMESARALGDAFTKLSLAKSNLSSVTA